MKTIEDMDVYKVAYQLVLSIYKMTEKFPGEEKFGLVSQMRRAAVSIVSNLSEGAARISPNELRQFIGIARGSVSELKTQIKLSCDLGMISKEQSETLQTDAERVRMMLNGFIKTLN
ncbi:MAG: four helix bundle protein [Rickettsiales bacterium]|jgi:four helix bundle protein|nr:four helix bundle protein [Rickettsiales bacterium]